MTASAPRDPTFRRDIASAYLASASRVGSWVIVSALVYRYLGAADFAVLALIRGTIGILNYVTLGLAPALIHYGAAPQPVLAGQRQRAEHTLEYAARLAADLSLPSLYANAMAIAFWVFLAGTGAVFLYAARFERILAAPPGLSVEISSVVLFVGAGTLLRLVGDVPGAVLQVRGRISTDNLLVAAGEIAWACLAAVFVARGRPEAFEAVAASYAVSAGIPLFGRILLARQETRAISFRAGWVRWPVIKVLLGYGGLVVLAQLADYLYAPTDYILIDRLLRPINLASYAPAVQIDAGLLLLVMGLSAVLLPKTAVAHAAGSSETVRRYYVRGTLASLAMLATASGIIWLVSPWIFRLWLGNPMTETQAILPLVLVNTVLGGSSAVGRSILLAVGKVRPFTIAALTSGAANVACSFVFVRYLHLGLKGIVLGTVVAVVGRCVVWMPWYVLSTIRAAGNIEPLTPLPLVPEP